MRYRFLILLMLPFLLLAKENATPTFTIGFSQCTDQDAWRQAMLLDIETSLLQSSNIKLIVKGANGNSQTQIAQIKELMVLGIDILVVSPNESQPLTAIISEIYQNGIPVIVVDRKIDNENYTQYIGANNYDIGLEAGRYAANLLNGEGSVMEIWGLPGSSPATERHNGFVAAIKAYPNIHITTSTTGEWNYQLARTSVESFVQAQAEIDLVFAHNDFMALGVYDAFIKNGIKNLPYILGVDGLYGVDGGIQSVIDGKFAATFLYPSGGSQIVESAIDILDGKSVDKDITLPTVAIDRKNAAALNAQMEKIGELGERIKLSRKVLSEQEALYESQGFRLRILLFTLLGISIIIIIGAVLYQRLRVQKEKIDHQNHELQRISDLLEEATQTKLRFFTNISHEFRTPITLLIGPLEDLLNSKSHSPADLKIYRLMHRNAKRLLRLVNQLMDFRKIDNSKMKLKANKYDIVSFTRDIKESFNALAIKEDIDFTFESDTESISLWFDRDKMDKSIFNLLSNAFKFTSENGMVSLSIEKVLYLFDNEKIPAVKITVFDNGLGMSEEELTFVFDRFYQVSGGSKGDYKGSGIGLALTKELVALHQGEITVSSHVGKGTTFSIYLREGDAHIDKSSQLIEDDGYAQPKVQIDTSKGAETIKLETTLQGEIPLLLIVEDNDDVRSFVRSGLEAHYRIQEADNGKIALEMIEAEEPDLVITDVMMPVMDGLELLKHLKSTRETCHIPVIILSARTTAEQKLEGLYVGADSYIPKPFNSEHLRIRVQKLIEGRQVLRKYYQQTIELSSNVSDGVSTLDKKFLKDARAAIENNIADSNFGVEELSQVCYISRVHLYRKIKHLTGLSATEFIRHIKLKRASILLLESGKSSSEIAYECGFSSPSYFAKRFKELFKMSPTDYLATHSK